MPERTFMDILRSSGPRYAAGLVRRGITNLGSLQFGLKQHFKNLTREEVKSLATIGREMVEAAENQVGLAAGETLSTVDIPINPVFGVFESQPRRYVYDVFVEFETPGTQELRGSTVRVNSDSLLSNEELLSELGPRMEGIARAYFGDAIEPGSERDTVVRIIPQYVMARY